MSERLPTYTVTTRSGEKVTLERLAAGLYRSGCQRFLFVDRDRDGAREAVNHRSGRYSIRRLSQGWQTFDLLTEFEEGYGSPYPLYYEGYPETLESAVRDLSRRQIEIDERVANGSAYRRAEPFTAAEALEGLF